MMKAGNITIRLMKAEDAKAVVVLVRKLAQSQGGDAPITAAQLQKNYRRPGLKIWVAVAGVKTVGYLASSMRFNMEYALDEWTMDYLFVEEKYRGQGVAQQLIQVWATAAMKAGAGALRTSALKSNKQANSLYKAIGFRQNKIIQQRYVAYGPDVVKIVQSIENRA